MKRQHIDPVVFPVPSFSRAALAIRLRVACGGEFTARDLKKLTDLSNRRMLFEAAWAAAEGLDKFWYFRLSQGAQWWSEWTLVVNPRAELH